MRKIIKIIGWILFGNSLSLRLFRYLNRESLIILGYHNVEDKMNEQDVKNPMLSIGIKRFEEQIKFLKTYYNPVDEKEVILALEKKKSLPPYAVWITFDDGFKNNYTNAFPILRKYKVPATFFICSGLVSFNNKSIRYMNWKDIRLLLGQGFSFGAHSIRHRVLSQLSNQKLANEIGRSKKKLEEELKIEIKSFAYPFGRKLHFDASKCCPILMRSGYRIAITTIRGKNCFNSLNKNCYTMKRIIISYDDTLNFFRAKVGSGGFGQKT